MKVWEKEHQTLTETLESFDQVKAKNLKQAKAEVDKWTKALAVAQKKFSSKEELFKKMDMDIQAKEAMLNGFLQVKYNETWDSVLFLFMIFCISNLKMVVLNNTK